MKRAIVFEGGGAKGAYEAGAVKALNKKKIFFVAFLFLFITLIAVK